MDCESSGAGAPRGSPNSCKATPLWSGYHGSDRPVPSAGRAGSDGRSFSTAARPINEPPRPTRTNRWCPGTGSRGVRRCEGSAGDAHGGRCQGPTGRRYSETGQEDSREMMKNGGLMSATSDEWIGECCAFGSPVWGRPIHLAWSEPPTRAVMGREPGIIDTRPSTTAWTPRPPTRVAGQPAANAAHSMSRTVPMVVHSPRPRHPRGRDHGPSGARPHRARSGS